MTEATLIAPAEPLIAPAEPVIAAPERRAPSGKLDRGATYSCPECGHTLRFSGLGRHRVYFELDDARSEDPVMSRVCPACGHGLPGKNAP
jgi:hypothetical protein